MKVYQNLLKDIMENGIDSDDRTGVGTRSVFGRQLRFDLSEAFPAVTTKQLAWKSVVSELLWFLSGSQDERYLAELLYGKPRTKLIDKRTIWTDNIDKQGKEKGFVNTDLYKPAGHIYGVNWRAFGNYYLSDELDGKMRHEGGVDQIMNVIESIKTNPNSRRHIVSAWNPERLGSEVLLEPCHILFQFYVRNGKLSCMWYQRSCDSFLGLPFNIASYALLTHMIARECGLAVGELIASIGDTHIYHNHFEQVQEQINRHPYDPPILLIDDEFDLMDRLQNGFEITDTGLFHLLDYNYHPKLSAPMAA